jgi:GNAT superfamily N-acetyltransferase
MDCTVEERDTGGKRSLEYYARCNGQHAGNILVVKTKVRGRVVWAVDTVSVYPQFQRRGVATKLYEAATAGACAKRGRLASVDRRPGAFSNDFWRKQAAKGRVEVFRGKRQPIYVLRDCSVRDLSSWP